MSRQYRDWYDQQEEPVHPDDLPEPDSDYVNMEREQLDAAAYECYIPTEEEEEAMRRDMEDTNLFGNVEVGTSDMDKYREENIEELPF